MAKVDHVDDADHLLVTAAVAEAERHTSGEILPNVANIPDTYEESPAALGTRPPAGRPLLP